MNSLLLMERKKWILPVLWSTSIGMTEDTSPFIRYSESSLGRALHPLVTLTLYCSSLPLRRPCFGACLPYWLGSFSLMRTPDATGHQGASLKSSMCLWFIMGYICSCACLPCECGQFSWVRALVQSPLYPPGTKIASDWLLRTEP